MPLIACSQELARNQSAVPPELIQLTHFEPNVKTLGYSQVFLRNRKTIRDVFHGSGSLESSSILNFTEAKVSNRPHF